MADLQDERGWPRTSVWCESCPCLFVQASMRQCTNLAVSHVKPVTSTRMYQQLDKREMSVTPLTWSDRLSQWERSVRSEWLAVSHCQWHDSSRKSQCWGGKNVDNAFVGVWLSYCHSVTVSSVRYTKHCVDGQPSEHSLWHTLVKSCGVV